MAIPLWGKSKVSQQGLSICSLANSAASPQLFMGIPGGGRVCPPTSLLSYHGTPAPNFPPLWLLVDHHRNHHRVFRYASPLETSVALSWDSHTSKPLLLITDLSHMLPECGASTFVFLDGAEVVLAQFHPLWAPTHFPIPIRRRSLCSLIKLPLCFPVWSPSYFFTVSSPLGYSPWGQDQKHSDLDQSVGVIIFQSESSCIPDLISMENTFPGWRVGETLPGMPRYM